MGRRTAYRRRHRGTPVWKIVLLIVLAVLLVVLIAAAVLVFTGDETGSAEEPDTESQTEESSAAVEVSADTPDEALLSYFLLLESGDYEGMYAMLDEGSREDAAEEDFVTRNQNIYEGIGASDIEVKIVDTGSSAETETGEEAGAAPNGSLVFYTVTMDTVAGSLSYDNHTTFVKEDGEWAVVWSDSMIFPDLSSTDSVKITTDEAERGSLYDRNGYLLAGTGTASSVGLVPGKMEDDTVSRLAAVLDVSEETIESRLSASWVTDDSFVPVKTVEKLTDQELLADTLSDETKEKQARDEALLDIPGVLVSDTQVRTYPLGEAAAHLVGYVQSITADELAADEEGVYTSTSLIGKTGLESLYEERLRGTPGKKIRIVSAAGETKKILAVSNTVDGEDITVTIDSDLQRLLYEQYQDNETASAAVNPYTGEVLALVSTPSYDPNAFILGLSQEQWDEWNNDEATPLVNRFRSAWTPGSTFKPVTAAIGLTAGLLSADEDYGYVGTSWQKDASWGSYKVTTLHAADPATVENAIVVSDNVFFARAAVTIGEEELVKAWDGLGFGEELPFAIRMTTSTYDNDGTIGSEVQIADSGYGQGEIQVNLLHLASIYTAFLNRGDMITPILEMSDEPGTVWKAGVFSEEACETVQNALIQVVESSSGTGNKAKTAGLTIAGKTGTAETKVNRDDSEGAELGWFISYTPETSEEDALLLVTMVQDVASYGGSSYVAAGSRSIYQTLGLQDQAETAETEAAADED